MQKLIIQDINKINANTYAIRLSGSEPSLTAMDSYLTRQSKDKAYWDENAFHGNGGWIIHLDFLRRISKHFENVERAVVIAERMDALKKINMLAKSKSR
jgi:hypothetical protein